MKKTKIEIIKHLQQEVYCKLGISKIAGIGVFALRSIPKGIDPLKSWLPTKEVEIPLKELNKLPTSVRKQVHSFCYVDNKDKYVSIPSYGMNAMNMAIYLNHSKNPNLRFKKNGTLVSLKNIRVGEELFIDYDESFGETHIFK
jgi:SET domain-containing protein